MERNINAPKVLMVGPGRDVMGGISTVVNSYYELGLEKKWNCVIFRPWKTEIK